MQTHSLWHLGCADLARHSSLASGGTEDRHEPPTGLDRTGI